MAYIDSSSEYVDSDSGANLIMRGCYTFLLLSVMIAMMSDAQRPIRHPNVALECMKPQFSKPVQTSIILRRFYG
jgi:hypothetical protein